MLFMACRKETEGGIPVQTEPADILTRISNDWTLRFYTITTDQGEYTYARNELVNHSLKTMKIRKEGTYFAYDIKWSGYYSLPTDSSHINFSPADLNRAAFTLHIDKLYNQEMTLSSPAVQVNPIRPDADEFEKFIAEHSLNFLYKRNIDIFSFKWVKIKFVYIS